MPRRLAAPLPEALDLVERQVVAGDVQQAVQQRRTVAGGEHEAVAVGPQRIGGVVLQESLPQHVGHRRRAERQAGMAAVGLLHHVDGKEAKRVDAALVRSEEHTSELQSLMRISYAVSCLKKKKMKNS